jgi:hypothetical protein
MKNDGLCAADLVQSYYTQQRISNPIKPYNFNELLTQTCGWWGMATRSNCKTVICHIPVESTRKERSSDGSLWVHKNNTRFEAPHRGRIQTCTTEDDAGNPELSRWKFSRKSNYQTPLPGSGHGPAHAKAGVQMNVTKTLVGSSDLINSGLVWKMKNTLWNRQIRKICNRKLFENNENMKRLWKFQPES